MARTATRPLRHLLASLLFTSSVLSLPSEIHIILENREVAQAAAPNWVTVGSDTIAVTVTPTVTGSDGKTTTYGNPPESLTTTGTYTLLPLSAAPTTSTGLPPVATASSDGTGTYLACDDYASTQDAPFCQPKSGTQLTPGNTYFGQSPLPSPSTDLTVSSNLVTHLLLQHLDLGRVTRDLPRRFRRRLY